MGDNVQSQASVLNKIDGPTVIHAAVIVIVVLVVYHFLFHR